MEENREEIVADAYRLNAPRNTLALKRQTNEWTHTLTHTSSESILFLLQNCKCKTTEMNHANGMADSCVQYYDFNLPKDWLHYLFFMYLVKENVLVRSPAE